MDLRLTRARSAGEGPRGAGGARRVYVRVQGVQAARIDAGRGAAARGGASRRPPVRLGAASARSSPESRLAAAGVSPRAPGGGGEPRAARLDAARSRSAPCTRVPRDLSQRRARSQAPRLAPVPPPPTPRLRPVFLWARQTDGTVQEVLCEDYDPRNRIRIARTPTGWRVIPRTEIYNSIRLTPVVPSERPRRPQRQQRPERRPRRPRGRPRRVRSPAPAPAPAPAAWLQPDLESHIPSHTIAVPRAPPEPTPLGNLLAVVEQEKKILDLEDSASFQYLPAEDVAREVMSFELEEPRPPDEMERVEGFSDDMVAHKDLFETISEAHYLPELGGPHDEALLESLVEKGCEDNQILGQTLDKLANLVHGSGEYPEEEEDMLISGAPVTDIINRLEHSLESPGRSSITAAQGLLHLHHMGDHLPTEHQEVDQRYISDEVYAEQHEKSAMDTLAAASELQEANQVNHIDYDSQNAEKRLENIVEPTDALYTEPVPESEETYEKESNAELAPEQSLPDQSEMTIPSDAISDNVCEDVSSKETSQEASSDDTQLETHAHQISDTKESDAQEDPKTFLERLNQTIYNVQKANNLTIERALTPLAVTTDIETPNTTIDDNLSDKSDDQPKDLSVHRRVPTSITPHASPRRPDIPRAPSRESDAMQSPQPSGIPAVPSSPEIFTMPSTKSKHTLFLETLLSSPSPKMYTSEVTITKQQCEPLYLGKHRKSASPTVTSCSDEMKPLPKEFGEPQEKRHKRHSTDDLANISKIFNSKCMDDHIVETRHKKASTPVPTQIPADENNPLKQIQKLKNSTELNIPDPLLVPRDRLELILQAPSREIPALLLQRPDLRLPDAFAFPALLRDPNIYVVSLSQLEKILIDRANKNEKEKEKESTKTESLETKSEKDIKRDVITTTSKSPKPSYTAEKVPTPQPQPDQTHHSNQQRHSANPEDLAGDIDAANFSQMWLPYMNLDFMKYLNAHGYSGANYADLAALNSSRLMGLGGFPMMPPMDYDARLQYAMMQEADRAARSMASSSQRKSGSMEAPKDPKSSQSDVQNPYVHSTKNHQSKTQSARTSPIAHNYNNQRAMAHNQFLQSMYPGMNPNVRPNMPLPGLQIPYFNPQMMGSQRSPRTGQQKSPTSPFYPNNNYLQSFKQSEQGLPRSGSAGSQDSPRPRISVKSLQNLMEPAAPGASVAARIGPSRRASIATTSMGRRREEPEVGSTTPCEAPPLMPPHPHDPASYHLWHPLFGNFYNKFKIPGVLGCIDCTHVAIVRPIVIEERYYCRKHYHSLNVQLICDANMQITSVDASFGGATHDSFIWNDHPLQAHLENLYNSENILLLGDSGYPLRRTMMTPIVDAASDTPEGHYTRLHVRARNVIEHTIGLLKARFRCLLVHRVLHYSPETAGFMVNACVILHNICNKANAPVPQLSDEEVNQEAQLQLGNAGAEELPHSNNLALQQGYATRSALIQQLWERRHV